MDSHVTLPDVTESQGGSSPCDVLYVHPAKHGVVSGPHWQQGANPYPFVPTGIVGLVNLLRQQGYNVRGVNVPLELSLDDRFSLARWLAAFRHVRAILVDLHWYEHSFGALDVSRVAKRVHPDSVIILGGLTASGYAKQIMSQEPSVDYVIRGDAEWPLLDLVEVCNLSVGDRALTEIDNLTYRIGGEIVSNPLGYVAGSRELAGQDFASIEWLDHAHAYALRQFSGFAPKTGHWLTIGRGCMHNCSYCGGCRDAQRTLAGRKGVVARPVENVLRDISRLCRRGIDQVAFNLDLFEMGDRYWQKLFAEMRQRQLHIGIYNEFSALCSAAFLDEMAGTVDVRRSRLAFSPLSGSETVRRLNGKAYTNDALLALLPHLQRHGLLVMMYFSLNLPGEIEAFGDTLAFGQELHQSYPEGMIDLINMCHTLDPLSPLSCKPKTYGATAEMRTFADYYAYCQRTRRGGPDARKGLWRGFAVTPDDTQALEAMAAEWDAVSENRIGWHTIPLTW